MCVPVGLYSGVLRSSSISKSVLHSLELRNAHDCIPLVVWHSRDCHWCVPWHWCNIRPRRNMGVPQVRTLQCLHALHLHTHLTCVCARRPHVHVLQASSQVWGCCHRQMGCVCSVGMHMPGYSLHILHSESREHRYRHRSSLHAHL